MPQMITIDQQSLIAYQIQTPHTSAMLIAAKSGFLACAYFDIAIAEKVGDAAAIVTGVKTLDDMLNAPVVRLSSAAAQLGVTVGMSGRDALLRLNDAS